MVAIEVAALNATLDPMEGRERQKAKNAASQMVLVGAWNFASTCAKKLGMPLSRAKAYIIRELDVSENSPQCQTAMMTRVKRTTAPSSPNMSSKICKTGCPTSLATVLSKSWMEKRRHMRRKKPKIAEQLIDIMIPSGALQDAFRVSSDRCAEASKPVMVY